jgi:hypothetical protein
MVLGSDLTRGTAPRGTALAAALLLFLGPALAACGGDDGGERTPPTPTAQDTAREDTTPTSPGATAPADAVAAEQEIKQNWQKFFDPGTSLRDKRDYLENGDRTGPVLQAFSDDKGVGQAEAEVGEVEFISPTAAKVTYALTLNGATAVPDAFGTAVEQDGTWKVSVRSLCALVALNQAPDASPPPGC